jgi:hypothetical protein
LADWKVSGGSIECNAPPLQRQQTFSVQQQKSARRLSWLEVIANWPLERLVGFWLGMILIFGVIYWLAGIGMGWGLQAGSSIVHRMSADSPQQLL